MLMRLLTAVLCVCAFARFAAAGVSPAPDMPAEWFWHDDAEQAQKHAALIGKPMPKLQIEKWFQGEVRSTEGKVVLIDLWATWCGPCKANMPHTDELAKKYADKGLVTMAICSSGDEAFVPGFIKEKKLSLPMAWDKDGATFKAFAGMWYPTYAVIDRKGIVRAIGLNPDGVEKAVQMLLAE